ncbi:MAG: flagellar biosynthesis anti-sigma factor FlgM [Novosphingobium sp.]|nr:flagellar biosynthesis anti-sigma factor FlgM [Novosphingobium sp.]
MPPIEIGPARAVGAIESRLARQAGTQSDRAKAAPSGEPAVVRSDALDPGPAPVDAERVRAIRDAVESGTYPVVPAKIADAMIAAGIMLRSGK